MKLRILIAEPDELLLAAYRAFLAAEGVEVLAVTNVPDCLVMLRKEAPDLLILDPEPAWEAGAEMNALLGEAKGRPAVPVLLLTSHPEKAAEAAYPARCGILIKPVPPALVACIVRTLAESKGALQASSA
jgi:DNA-binding NarL/FixJ family response regulator